MTVCMRLHQQGNVFMNSISVDPDCLLTEGQTGELINVPVRTLQTWRLRGGGPPFVKLGRSIRYRRWNLIRWIEEHTMNSTSQLVSI